MSEDEGDVVVATPSKWTGLLPWQHDAARTALAGRATWPHALLLTGREGIGKRVLALEFARALLCEAVRADGSACGECPGCRYVAAFQHPDLRIVEPVEIDDEGAATPAPWIAVAHIRALIEWAQLTSHRRMAKVAVIVPAERMNAAAANALLKTLEEPPEGTYLILVSHQPGRLPATVRSRCRVMAAPLPEFESARAWLAEQGAREPDALLAQAGGAPLAALALDVPGYQAERAAWLSALAAPDALEPVTLAGRIDTAPRELRKERLAAAIDWLSAWCADIAAARAGNTPRRNADHAAAIAALGRAVAPVPLFRYYRSLAQARAQIAHPLTPRLVAEALLFDYLNLFH
jgi:DNA polymerase-3 subunit delta'